MLSVLCLEIFHHIFKASSIFAFQWQQRASEQGTNASWQIHCISIKILIKTYIYNFTLSVATVKDRKSSLKYNYT